MIREKEIEFIKTAITALDYPTSEELWNAVKGKISRSDFDKLIGYLVRTNRILINNGDIFWTWNPKLADRIFSNKELLIK